jgi:hypothetical protein
MAINFTTDQTVINSQVKALQVKVCKLTFANFGTTPVNTLIATFPPNAAITRIAYWNKTKLAGNSISAATLSLGFASAGTTIVSAFDVFTTVGTNATLSPSNLILQTTIGEGSGGDYKIWAQGSATTGDPDAGEIYVIFEYVR